MAKIWDDMSVSRRKNDVTLLRNIKLSPGKSRKIPQLVTNPGKSTDSLTIQTRFHVEIRIVIFFWITHIYIYIQFSWIDQLVENIAIMSRRWNTSVFLRDKRNITKTNKTVFSICSVKQKNRTILTKMFKVNTVETSVHKFHKLKRLHQ